MTQKKVLLIAGGGTLGEYTAKELIKKGCVVDIICLEDNISDNGNLHYCKANATYEYLVEFLKNKFYDAIVNFIHYTSTEDYKPVHMFLSGKCSQLVFLSSYRVYADLQHPITETAPQLYNTVDDSVFLNTENYAVPKSKNEKFIIAESNTDNWTIVRPVISFSKRRFDIVTENQNILERIQANETILLPIGAKHLTAAVDWAGNSGKLIANLLFKEKALKEAFTVSSAQNLTWENVSDCYKELVGAKFKWVSNEEYIKSRADLQNAPWILKYDRLFDRKIDNNKILAVSGLKKEDFTSIKEGIKIEIDRKRKENNYESNSCE